MIHIPLSAVPNQTLSITLAGQAFQVALRQNGDNMYIDLTAGGSSVIRTRICRNRQRLLLDAQYHGVVGDFFFNDSQGDTDPQYLGLDVRYKLYYLEVADLE